ncbi:MAG: hypothetical protein EON86_09900 [Brevundimonas sp.]|nr:MAG: hypothetical protein EON86_09900 [Brevundimonas sp.]
MKQAAIIAFALLAAGCATRAPEPDLLAEMFSGVPAARSDRTAAGLTGHPLGSQQNPIRVHFPAGERAYLARLRCADQRAPQVERIGSFGMGPYGMIIDGYDVRCPGSTPATSTLYLDMYHPDHVETAAPPGFKIIP